MTRGIRDIRNTQAAPVTRSEATGIELVLVTAALFVGAGRNRLVPSAVADLVIELGTGSSPPCPPTSECPAPGGLREALARALADPDLEVAYWLPGAGLYVDAGGCAVTVPESTARRAVTMVEHEGHRVAALVHDTALLEDEHLVGSVCAAAGLALENGRLQAELQARLADLAASRTRIVEAGEAERRRIERDLHDGTQQRLVSVAMTLGLAEARAANDPGRTQTLLQEARAGLTEALRELRELSQGIHPGILTERGLPGAVEELTSRARIPVHVDVTLARRLPEHIEAAAYFVVAEGLTNVAKHVQAPEVRVAVAESDGWVRVAVSDIGPGGADERQGTGLRGLRDRVEAIGGRLSVHSPAGGGTTLTAEIPCGS
jgi:signal transduction histidine kinase